MVGMPYPNRNSPELQEKMAYLTATMGSHAGEWVCRTPTGTVLSSRRRWPTSQLPWAVMQVSGYAVPQQEQSELQEKMAYLTATMGSHGGE